ncbi:hypothetical protein GEMRC1_012134 [Eukaryota sp. GEM-RC1]
MSSCIPQENALSSVDDQQLPALTETSPVSPPISPISPPISPSSPHSPPPPSSPPPTELSQDNSDDIVEINLEDEQICTDSNVSDNRESINSDVNSSSLDNIQEDVNMEDSEAEAAQMFTLDVDMGRKLFYDNQYHCFVHGCHKSFKVLNKFITHINDCHMFAVTGEDLVQFDLVRCAHCPRIVTRKGIKMHLASCKNINDNVKICPIPPKVFNCFGTN